MTAITTQPPIPWPQRLKRIAWRILRFVAFAYVAVSVVFYLLQEKLIFIGAGTQGTKEAIVSPTPGTQLLSLPAAGGEHVAAIFGPALTPDGRPLPDGAGAPTIIFFYGNAMTIQDMTDFANFRTLGANVMVPEYLGYGMSSGKPSEAGCYAAADAAWEWLQHQPDVDGKKVIAVGWSLGAAVAVDLAARQPVAGLAIFSAFTSMADEGRYHYPFLPVGLLLKHRFESLQKIPKVTCPIVIGHGLSDNVIPYAMSDQLAAAAKAPIVARISAPETYHNDFMSNADAEIRAALTKLMRRANGR